MIQVFYCVLTKFTIQYSILYFLHMTSNTNWSLFIHGRAGWFYEHTIWEKNALVTSDGGYEQMLAVLCLFWGSSLPHRALWFLSFFKTFGRLVEGRCWHCGPSALRFRMGIDTHTHTRTQSTRIISDTPAADGFCFLWNELAIIQPSALAPETSMRWACVSLEMQIIVTWQNLWPSMTIHHPPPTIMEADQDPLWRKMVFHGPMFHFYISESPGV